MSIDPTTKSLIRVMHSIRGAMDAVEPRAAGLSGTSLPDAYVRLRAEVHTLLPETVRDEFDRICPETQWSVVDIRRDELVAAKSYNEARALLGGMAGWIDGYVAAEQTEAQIEANAVAYAREKAKSEIGFRPPSASA